MGAYAYVEGMQDLLRQLQDAGIAMHVMSNYPSWHRDLESRLRLSRYLPWSFLSCEGPMEGLRKPAPAAFSAVAETLAASHSEALQLTLVDDRLPNVEAARAAGWQAVHFQGCTHLREQLAELGILRTIRI